MSLPDPADVVKQRELTREAYHDVPVGFRSTGVVDGKEHLMTLDLGG